MVTIGLEMSLGDSRNNTAGIEVLADIRMIAPLGGVDVLSSKSSHRWLLQKETMRADINERWGTPY